MAPTERGDELAKGISEGTSRSEVLLYATMCIVGLPVEVQVKDGSLYSGIMHTACFDRDHGIVLKKARKIGKGKSCTNLILGDLVDTLVVLSSDLVQVIVKGLLLPTEGTVGHFAGETAVAANEYTSESFSENTNKRENGSTCAPRPVTGCRPEDKKHHDSIEEVVHEVHHLSPSTNANGARCSSSASLPSRQVSPECQAPTSTICPLPDAKTSVCSTSSAMASVVRALSFPSRSTSSDTTVPVRNKTRSIGAKESKLNPSAKVFTPSTGNIRQVSTSVPRFVSPSQMSNNLPAMPIPGTQLGTEVSSLASRLTVPRKMLPYNNVIAAQAGTGTHYHRPFMGHANVQLPVRMNGQYHPLQAGNLYLNPHSQMVAVGPFNQPAYMHQVSQDTIHGTPITPHAQPHPRFAPANALKFQAAAQTMHLPMTQPIMAVENQNLVTPAHAPFSQSFPFTQPIMIPGGNGYILR